MSAVSDAEKIDGSTSRGATGLATAQCAAPTLLLRTPLRPAGGVHVRCERFCMMMQLAQQPSLHTTMLEAAAF